MIEHGEKIDVIEENVVETHDHVIKGGEELEQVKFILLKNNQYRLKNIKNQLKEYISA